MGECPRCQRANPDSAEWCCDCGFDLLPSDGPDQAALLTRREVPTVVKLHAGITAAVFGLRIWSETNAGGNAEPNDAVVYMVLLAVLAMLFVLMLSGKAWARIILGVLTLPAGLLLLLPQAARDFTDPYYRKKASNDVLG